MISGADDIFGETVRSRAEEFGFEATPQPLIDREEHLTTIGSPFCKKKGAF
jgi:hypothetical protein